MSVEFESSVVKLGEIGEELPIADQFSFLTGEYSRKYRLPEGVLSVETDREKTIVLLSPGHFASARCVSGDSSVIVYAPTAGLEEIQVIGDAAVSLVSMSIGEHKEDVVQQLLIQHKREL